MPPIVTPLQRFKNAFDDLYLLYVIVFLVMYHGYMYIQVGYITTYRCRLDLHTRWLTLFLHPPTMRKINLNAQTTLQMQQALYRGLQN